MHNANQGQGPTLGMDLQWFAEEAGNPPQGQDSGSKAAGSFATELASEDPGTKKPEQGAAPEGQKPEGDPGKPAESPELPGWTAAMTKALKADQRITTYASKFKSLDDMVRSGAELEGKIGKMVALPDEKATEQERAQFWARFGVPEKAADYKLDQDPKIKTDAKELEEFKTLAHSMHLSNEQANAMFKMASARAIQEVEGFKARQEEARNSVETTLRQEWKENYDKERALVSRGLRAYGSPALLEDAARTGMGNSVEFIRLFHRLGQLSLEDSALGRAGAQGGGKKDPAQVLYPETP